jgi:hypothetical protein
MQQGFVQLFLEKRKGGKLLQLVLGRGGVTLSLSLSLSPYIYTPS